MIDNAGIVYTFPALLSSVARLAEKGHTGQHIAIRVWGTPFGTRPEKVKVYSNQLKDEVD